MKGKIYQRLKTIRLFSCLILIIGILLLIYMVRVEDEPGALTLFLIIAGSVCLSFTQHRIKKILQ